MPQGVRHAVDTPLHAIMLGVAKLWVFVHCTDLYLESERAFALFCHSMETRATHGLDAVAAAFDMSTVSNGKSPKVTVYPCSIQCGIEIYFRENKIPVLCCCVMYFKRAFVNIMSTDAVIGVIQSAGAVA